MPALSPTMTEGKLAKWLISEGEQVVSGDVIAEIETDKAVMEVEALDDGIMASIIISEGTEGVTVGTIIAEILDVGEESQIDQIKGVQSSNPSTNASQKLHQPIDEALQDFEVKRESERVPTSSSSSRILATPLAKRIASDLGIDLSTITGSGPKGRIIKSDVENLQISSKVQASYKSTTELSGANTESTLVENSQMRMVIADRLQRSKQDAPHFYLNTDIDIGAMLEARAVLNKNAPNGIKISVNDMIIKAAAIALKRVPKANASWEGTHTRLWRKANISVAVAVEGGLVTPIIAAAEDKGLNSISIEMADLASRAREGKLMPEEYNGGSFTISNLGMYGITSFSAVINPPQGAILAVGVGEDRAVVRNGNLDVATMMTATLSCDHRVVDGAVGAEWLKTFKEIVENPVLALA